MHMLLNPSDARMAGPTQMLPYHQGEIPAGTGERRVKMEVTSGSGAPILRSLNIIEFEKAQKQQW